jgi:hypothetical protein
MPALQLSEIALDTKGRCYLDVVVASQRFAPTKDGGKFMLNLCMEIQAGPNQGKQVYLGLGLGPEDWIRIGRDGSTFGTRDTLEKCFKYTGGIEYIRDVNLLGQEVTACLESHEYNNQQTIRVKSIYPRQEDRMSPDQWRALIASHGKTADVIAVSGGEMTGQTTDDLPY